MYHFKFSISHSVLFVFARERDAWNGLCDFSGQQNVILSYGAEMAGPCSNKELFWK